MSVGEQAGLSLTWLQTPKDTISRDLAHLPLVLFSAVHHVFVYRALLQHWLISEWKIFCYLKFNKSHIWIGSVSNKNKNRLSELNALKNETCIVYRLLLKQLLLLCLLLRWGLHDPKKVNWNLKLNFIECPIINHLILSPRFCPRPVREKCQKVSITLKPFGIFW